ncbi:hypothetical protein FSP39_021012 [Pinctada imbricata]|uniref:BTB domain-containing protein n=1 Tax=Pinctada imbricata TaxID=66713 RepID=A0AA88YS52_PINIB|nr:hypothetical protein FSP39_021012 [Pinctada imbricata]
MSCYQKFYSNQIHSSSLMCQLATMWKSQVLCDAIIRTGTVITKAHRLVLVAACPMLQSMENASMGSHLEVRLASDIKQDSVNTFLQYLYEGFMMLTEENCKDVEKIARLLQVDSIIKCISDFYKCLSAKTGCNIDDRYKYSSFDLLEFKHIRASSIQKTLHEAALKRGSDFSRPQSPGNKRQRLHRAPSPNDSRLNQRADDTLSMAHSYTQGGQGRDPWDPRGRGGTRVPPQPGVIDIVEDSIEIIQSDQSDKGDGHIKQKSVSIGVTSQYNTATDVRVVSVNDSGGTGKLHTSGAKSHDPLQNSNSDARGSITVSPLPIFDSSSSQSSINRTSDSQMDIPSVRPTPPSQPVFPTLTPIPKQSVPKPFAAGSMSQATSSPSSSEAKSVSPSNADHTDKRDTANKDDVISEDGTPDLKIVKIETNDSLTGGLDMYVDKGEDGMLRLHGIEDRQNDDGSDVEHDHSVDWSKEEMSNEGSNVSTDQNNSWYIDQFKGWLTSENLPTSFEKFSPPRLNDVLEQFYSDFKSMHAGPFNINKLGDVREGLFTYLKGVNSTWKNYLSHPAHTQKYKVNEVKRKVSMSGDDVRRLMNSGVLDIDTPLGLFRKVWLDLAIHLGIGGQAAMRSLTFDSFVAETDDKGRRYYRLNRDGVDRQQARSCMEMQYWNWEGKMYEISNDRLCPVKSMDRYYERRNMMRESFFQRPKTSVHHLETSWFESPVGHSVLACLLTKMSEESMLQKSYTNF